MSDDPLDLAALARVDSPEVVAEAMRRFRRRVLFRTAWALVFAMAIGSIVVGEAVSKDQDIQARISTGAYYNGREGDFRVAGVDIGLVKVTVLSGDRYGLQFILHSEDSLATRCCGLQLDEASEVVSGSSLSGGASGSQPHFSEVFAAVPATAGRMIDFKFVDQTGKELGSFTVDLDELQVPPIGG